MAFNLTRKPQATHRHVGVEINQGNLYLGTEARSQTPHRLLAVNPVGAYRSLSQPANPINVLALTESGDILWAMPLDRRRLSFSETLDEDKAAFHNFWDTFSTLMQLPATGPATFWEPRCAVGVQPESLPNLGDQTWVEYKGRKPWVTLGEWPGSNLQVVCPVSTQNQRRPDFQAPYDAAMVTIYPERAQDLQPEQGWVEKVHFAILDPVAEGWPKVGQLAPGNLAPGNNEAHGLAYVRLREHGWPQRDHNGQVLLT